MITYWVIGVYDSENSFHKFIHIKDLVKVLFTLLTDSQDTKSWKICPEEDGSNT